MSRCGDVHLITYRCEQGDDLRQWGWEKHDGRNFGVQKILDRGVTLVTSFVKVPGGSHGGDWSARIQATGPKGAEVSLLYMYRCSAVPVPVPVQMYTCTCACTCNYTCTCTCTCTCR